MLEELDGVKFPVAVNGQHLKKYFSSMWEGECQESMRSIHLAVLRKANTLSWPVKKRKIGQHVELAGKKKWMRGQHVELARKNTYEKWTADVEPST